MGPWAELGAPAVLPAPSEDRHWRSVPARHSGSTPVGVLEPATRQEEWALPAAELVEQRVPEALEASGPVPPAAAAEYEAGTAAGAAGTTGPASGAAAAAAGTDTEARCCYPTQQEPSSSSCPQSPGACARC
jgi:hypothetical protein